MLICECGEILHGDTFRDYIKTSACPSTRTFGHKKCGYVFNFIDDKSHKKYSSRTELKSLAMRFAEKNKMESGDTEQLLLEVDRLKSKGSLSDRDILVKAFNNIVK
ncbi:hypothetical protein ig2599ANME_1275 [groundwater metagenome]